MFVLSSTFSTLLDNFNKLKDSHTKLLTTSEEYHQELDRLTQEKNVLEAEIKKLKHKDKHDVSKLIYSIDFLEGKFKITPYTKVNDKIIDHLVEHEYLRADQVNDSLAVQMAFIVLAADAADSFIDQVNAGEYDSV